MSKKLTALAVENAKPKRNDNGELTRTEVPDAGCPGLFLIVQPSRAKSWALRYRVAGVSKKLTLGPAAISADGQGLTLSAARVAAAAAAHEVSHGLDLVEAGSATPNSQPGSSQRL